MNLMNAQSLSVDKVAVIVKGCIEVLGQGEGESLLDQLLVELRLKKGVMDRLQTVLKAGMADMWVVDRHGGGLEYSLGTEFLAELPEPARQYCRERCINQRGRISPAVRKAMVEAASRAARSVKHREAIRAELSRLEPGQPAEAWDQAIDAGYKANKEAEPTNTTAPATAPASEPLKTTESVETAPPTTSEVNHETQAQAAKETLAREAETLDQEDDVARPELMAHVGKSLGMLRSLDKDLGVKMDNLQGVRNQLRASIGRLKDIELKLVKGRVPVATIKAELDEFLKG